VPGAEAEGDREVDQVEGCAVGVEVAARVAEGLADHVRRLVVVPQPVAADRAPAAVRAARALRQRLVLARAPYVWP
jgi:hypothetical protein